METILHKSEPDGASQTRNSVADTVSNGIGFVAFSPPTPNAHNGVHHYPTKESIEQLLRDVATSIRGQKRYGVDDDDNYFKYENNNRSSRSNSNDYTSFEGKDDCEEGGEAEWADGLVRRIRANDPKLTTLALRKTPWQAGVTVDVGWNQVRSITCDPLKRRALPWSPSLRRLEITRNTIPRLTEALQTNHTIRSISCRYDWKYPKPAHSSHPRLLEDEHEFDGSGEVDIDIDNKNNSDGSNNNNDNNFTRPATINSIVAYKLQERRFFEACVCLPRLESISLTGGNRWKVSHLLTILEAAKGLRRLTVHDVVVHSSSELHGFRRVLLGRTRTTHRGDRYDAEEDTPRLSIPLEAIELTIEDQTRDRCEPYWRTDATSSPSGDDDGGGGGDGEELSPFDELLQALAVSGNLRTIKISKSILSRIRLRRTVPDISTTTLRILAGFQSLSRLILSGLSVQNGAVAAMCEALMKNNGHLAHLEFSGCAFHQTVGQSGWNALFRLVRHDPDIHIRASSLVYNHRNQPRRRPGSESDTIHSGYSDEPLGARSRLFVQHAREDVSFSLRDREGVDRHFRNRGLDIEFMLREAGLFRLLREQETNGNANAASDWIDVMTKVKDDVIALFCILRENPSLCNRSRVAANVILKQ